MTYLGAIKQLQELKNAEDMPIYYKPAIAEVINVLLTDAQEVRHGRWIHGREVSRDYIGDACVAIHYEKWWCSECDYPVDGIPLWNYCPSCGARMI